MSADFSQSLPASFPARLPAPFTRAPGAFVRELAAAAPVPEGFCGRAGLLVTEKSGRFAVRYAFERSPERARVSSYRALRAEALWPCLGAEAVPARSIVTGRGETLTLVAFFEEMFAPYPARLWDQGGRELEMRRAQWRFAICDALGSPGVVLLLDHNRGLGAGGRPAALAEWWIGPSPAHEVRCSGTFYPPRAAAKFLYEKLLDGIPHDEVEPRVADSAALETVMPLLYEDDAVVIVNKPSRLASVPGVRERVSAKSILERTRGPLRVVHRLDMDTSGVLLFAKTPEAEKTLHTAFREGLAMKRYEARLEGELSPDFGRAGTVNLPLALNLLDRPRQCVLPESEGGREALTDWELIGTDVMPDGRRKSRLSLYPETGRTHQLRLHCAHREGLGIAIDGDPFYSSLGLLGEGAGVRLCLHAASLTIPHPTTGIPITAEAPADFPLF